jgi:excinuclease ABC subunit A
MKSNRKPSATARRTRNEAIPKSADQQPNRNQINRFIEIRGARTHNLKNVDLDIPRGKLTVITGVSGSGKSSLAFDTLFAEGQRQYMESLSSYARQFLDQMERPDVDSIRGLQPALCIDQQQGSASSRSTVGTVTEIYDYLRLLMARIATPACHQCGSPIERQSTMQIANSIHALPIGTKLTIAAPMVIGRKGGHADVLERIAKAGLLRARIDGQQYEIEDLPTLAVRKEHSISAIVDRIVVREDSRERIDQAIAVSIRLSNGLV